MSTKTNEQIVNRHGDFVWYELMTTDAEAAQEFYGGLAGWTFEDSSFNEVDYRTFSGSGGHVGGFLSLTEDMISTGARPAWVGYVGVEDVNGTISAVQDKAGSLIFGPGEVPDVGPFALVADPQGAIFYIIDDRSGMPSRAFAAYEPVDGHCAWNELVTADPGAAKHWYGNLFGFVQQEAMDMGPMGEYCIMHNAGQDFAFGAMMKKPDEMPVSLWIYYFRVPDIDVAAEYVPANGGQVLMAPMEIPGGEFVLQGMDPQGALFALIGKRA